MTGIVKCFDPMKCYGFIRAEDRSDVFVLTKYILRDEAFGFRHMLVKGDVVSYEVARDEHGRVYAENVRLLESPIKSVDPYAYVEQGTILPPNDPSGPRTRRSDASYIHRPDQSYLFVRFEDVVTEGLDRVKSGESLPCAYRVDSWGTTKIMLAARDVKLFEPAELSDEDLFLEAVKNVAVTDKD